jgi:hypothetical protein
VAGHLGPRVPILNVSLVDLGESTDKTFVTGTPGYLGTWYLLVPGYIVLAGVQSGLHSRNPWVLILMATARR